MEVENLSKLFDNWYKYIINKQTDGSDVKKQIIHIDYLINELKDEVENPEVKYLQQKIKEEKEQIKKDEKEYDDVKNQAKLPQVSKPDKIANPVEEFIKTSYKQFITRCLNDVKATQEQLHILKITSDNIVITGEEFIKTSYKKFIVQHSRLNGVKATQELMNILQKCYRFCIEEADTQMKEITRTYECYTEEVNGLRQLSAYQALNGLIQRCLKKLRLHRRSGSSNPEQLERIRQYIHLCVEISWIIVIQPLPFELNFDISKKDGDNNSTFHRAFRCDNVKTFTPEKQDRNNGYEVVYPALMQGDRIIIHGIQQLKT